VGGLWRGLHLQLFFITVAKQSFFYITEFQYMPYIIKMYRLEIHVKNLFYAEVWHGMTKQTTGLYMEYNDAVKAGHDLASGTVQGAPNA